MGVLKKLTTEYFGDTERLEDRVVMDGVIRVDFTDKNGKRHRNGYRIVDGGHDTLKKLIRKLVDTRGPECDLNDVDVSNVTDMSRMFVYSGFNGNISGWDVSNVTNMSYMFANSFFNEDISGWDVSKVESMAGMFYNSNFNGDISGWKVNPDCKMMDMFFNTPLKNNPPEWYKEK